MKKCEEQNICHQCNTDGTWSYILIFHALSWVQWWQNGHFLTYLIRGLAEKFMLQSLEQRTEIQTCIKSDLILQSCWANTIPTGFIMRRTAQRARTLTSSYTWILNALQTRNTGTCDKAPLLSLQSENLNQRLQIYSPAERPHLPYVIFNTPWSSGSTLSPIWDLEDLVFTSSSHLPHKKPDLSLISEANSPIPPEGDNAGPWAVLAVYYSCTHYCARDTQRWNGWRGSEVSEHTRISSHRGIFIHME